MDLCYAHSTDGPVQPNGMRWIPTSWWKLAPPMEERHRRDFDSCHCFLPCQSTDYTVQENLCMWKECLESHWKDRVLAMERRQNDNSFPSSVVKSLFCICEGLHGNSLIWCPSNVIHYFLWIVPELWWTFLPKEIINPVCLPLNCRNIIKSPQSPNSLATEICDDHSDFCESASAHFRCRS